MNVRVWFRKNNRILHRILCGLCLMLSLSVGVGFVSHAYTEEEKQQAKAWLSAHGYSPDMGGASQAYQDYLDGKFDEELGRTTTEMVTTESSEEVTTTEEITDTTTEQKEEATTEASTETSSEQINGNVSTNETESSDILEDKAQKDSNEQAELEGFDTENETVEDEAVASLEEEKEYVSTETTWYRQDYKDRYENALAVIGASVLFMGILWMIRRFL